MTEHEWLTWTGSLDDDVLNFLEQKCSSIRKMRLFGCACARRTRSMLSREGRLVLELAEQYADGLIADEALISARQSLEETIKGTPWMAVKGVCTTPLISAALAVQCMARTKQEIIDESDDYETHGSLEQWTVSYASWASSNEAEECAVQSSLLRDIYGPLPFRRIFAEQSWLTPAIVNVARKIYDERVFERTPELGEMLKTAGCVNADVLAHCQAHEAHVRGCWVIDLLLGHS